MKTFIISFVLLFFSVCAYGGGFNIVKESITFNQLPRGSSFAPGKTITMNYMAVDYSFSGGGERFEYALFEFRNKGTGKIFYALKLVRNYPIGDDESGALEYKMDFSISQTGHYEISYYRVPFFTKDPLQRPENVFSIAEKVKLLIPPLQLKERLCEINITTNKVVISDMALYLRLNNTVPGYSNITDNFKEVNFSFLIKNQTTEKNILFRYRLYPDDTWSEWQTDNKANYFFINKGIHQFQVECQYDQDGKHNSLGIAKYGFTLYKPFVSNPKLLDRSSEDKMITFIDKGDIKQRVPNADVVLSKVYDKSKALLIGVDKFNDRTFIPLPYVKNDVTAVSNVLTSMNFDVHKSSSRSRTGIMNEIRGELAGLNKNDRLIVYISSHGFLDALDGKSKIATAECMQRNPTEAISVEELKDLIKGASEHCRHVLLILDCCASGMGVIEKNNSIGALRGLATQKGTSILTAGMSDQNAEMSDDLKMSVFTHYLVDGLVNKKADYTKDEIVTLTELLIYVQYNVAKYTNSQQIPMSGRISGSGEMIFY